jgi:hypothetical protein
MGVEVHDPRWLTAVPGAELVVGLDDVGECAANGHRTTVLIDLVPATVPLIRGMAAEAVGEGARSRYALGALGSMPETFDGLVSAWDPEPVRDLCRVALGRALADTGPLVSWYEHLTRTAAELPAGC